MAMEDAYSAHNYHPLPVVLDRGAGARVWDPEGREYIDFLSAYSAVNHGHCHPAVVGTLIAQAHKLTLSSRAFHNSVFPKFAKCITELLKYDMVLPMNTGAEAVETAMKLARRWAYVKKGVPEDKARIFSASGNFHGRTIGVISMSTDPDSRNGFGPMLDRVGPRVGDITIRYNHAEDVEAMLDKYGSETAAVLLEPIQGEGGILPAQVEWLTALRQRCTAVGAALIYDEIQCGLFRTGHMWCHSAMPVEAHPDMVTMAKPLANGFPIGAVLMRPHIAHAIAAGDHGTTFGGGPLTCRIAHHVLGRLGEPRMKEHIDSVSTYLFERLERISEAFSDMVSAPRGRGLIVGISMRSAPWAGEVVRLARERGVLFLTAGSDAVRFVPSLIVERAHIDEAMDVLESVLLVLRST